MSSKGLPPDHDPTGLERFPDWEELYKTTDARTLPWYSPGLDPDLSEELNKRNLRHGRFLDVGTGPGTQAIQLAALGFTVTGSDLSVSAIERARKLLGPVEFVQDDILQSRIKGHFDFIFDRGCFHTLDPEARARYVSTVTKLLNPKGLLFLKTFSREQPGDWGPHRFNEAEIRTIFGEAFEVVSAKPTLYQGTLEETPKALFCVLRVK